MAPVPVVPGSQIVQSAPAPVVGGTDERAVELGNGQALKVAPCTPCVACPTLSGWGIAGIVIVSVVLLAVLAMAIAAIVMKARTTA